MGGLAYPPAMQGTSASERRLAGMRSLKSTKRRRLEYEFLCMMAVKDTKRGGTGSEGKATLVEDGATSWREKMIGQ